MNRFKHSSIQKLGVVRSHIREQLQTKMIIEANQKCCHEHSETIDKTIICTNDINDFELPIIGDGE